jgi:hypothetical protein
MTRDEAIAIRERQLSGQSVDREQVTEAMNVLQITSKRSRDLYRNGAPRQVLGLLTSGPVERDAFRSEASKFNRSRDILSRLAQKGFIKYEVRLTEDGLRALGLVGPT